MEREQSLVDQWVSLTEERNAVLVPAAGSGIPGAPADWNPPAGMEPHIPVLFLDLNGTLKNLISLFSAEWCFPCCETSRACAPFYEEKFNCLWEIESFRSRRSHDPPVRGGSFRNWTELHSAQGTRQQVLQFTYNSTHRKGRMCHRCLGLQYTRQHTLEQSHGW